MFGRIAGRYDLGNRILSLGRDQSWRRVAVRILAPGPGDRVLDVGAGTGDLSLALARRAGAVIALDFSRPMLTLGIQKASKQRRLGGMAFVVSDALHLPFSPASFDGVATAFTMRNLTSMTDGFQEVLRILKPGGRMVCLEFTKPRWRVVRAVYRPYLNRLLPFLGGRLTGDAAAYRYLSSSINAFPTAEEMGAIIREAGFGGVRWRLLNWGTVAVHVGEKPAAVTR